MPAFAPDGRRLAYVHSVRDPLALHILGRQVAQASIYVKLLEAGTEIRVTNHTGADYLPAWSPNGDYIAFYRDDREAAGYYVVSALGGSEKRITDQHGSSAGITWSWWPRARSLAGVRRIARLATVWHFRRDWPQASARIPAGRHVGRCLASVLARWKNSGVRRRTRRRI